MELKNKKILIAAQYAPPYAGNFIPSLKKLSEKLVILGNDVNFAFPKSACNHDWAKALANKYIVYFTGDNFSLVTSKDLERLTSFDLVYTHFEGYDTAFIQSMPNTTKFVWHMQDSLSFHPNPLKAAYQVYAFWKHYGKPFYKYDISLISVNDHERNFIRPYRLGRKIHEITIHNGIDISRVEQYKDKSNKPFIFLAYGGRNVSKRVDIILKAGEMLNNIVKDGWRVMITKGTDTEDVIRIFYGNKLPDWLTLVNQVKDINDLLAKANCFISSSDYETFSYAVAEAVVAAIPVIQSDIAGTKWNEKSPATLVFPQGNAKILCQRMKEILETPYEKLTSNADAAREQIIGSLSLDSWTDRILDFFKSI